MPMASCDGFGAVSDLAMIMKAPTIPSTVPSSPNIGAKPPISDT